MKTISSTPQWLSALRKVIAVVALTGLGVGVAAAATPLAGTTIGNQAAATYTDASLTPRTATSNTVTTIVAQVAAFTLTASQSQTAAPGAPVNFPHTITNTGNGTDSFALSLTNTFGGTMALPDASFFIDANCNGVADNATPIVTISGVAPGASACFIAVTTVPVSATSGNADQFVVTADSTLDITTPTQSNTDDVTVSAQAIINVTKSISLASGPAGTTPVTYTLTYTNTGNNPATNVILADFLPATAPNSMGYIPGSAILNGVAVTDAADADAFSYAAGEVTAVIPSVAAGQTGTLRFNVTVSATATPGQINNQARYCYNDGLAAAGSVNIPAACAGTVAAVTAGVASSATAGNGSPTNTVTFTVLQTAGVAANADATGILMDGTDGGGAGDIVTVASAPQGATVTFNDYIHNNGNGTDTYNLALSAGSFPAGTTFLLYKSDGVTPLTDTNSIPDGVIDTGPIAKGTAYLVVIKAVLPSGASGNNGGAGYSHVLTATSSFNPTGAQGTGWDTVTNKLTTIAPNTVDLTTGAAVADTATPVATAGAQGYGAGPSSAYGTATVNGAPQPGLGVNPGASVTYPLHVNNTSTVADTYVVTATGVPAGWTVAYYFDNSAGACTTLGAPVTNTGVINGLAGTVVSDKVVCAVVTPPAGTVPGQNDITFHATSPTTLVTDSKLETVWVNTVRSITLTPPNAGQVFPSGSKVYSHILTNTGNVNEVAIGMTDPMSGVTTGWANIVYLDNTGAGTVGSLDPADTVVSNTTLASLAPGSSVLLFVKVLSPASASAGDINTSDLTATVTGLINSIPAPAAAVAKDNTTVIVGQVILSKVQALDAACDGTADTAFSNASITAGAIPGSCVMYQVTAQNVGTADVTNVVVSDATPANTTYIAGGAIAAAAISAPTPALAVPNPAPQIGVPTALPASLSSGTIAATIGILAPGQTSTLSFEIKINP